jgi:hypothetical protein
MRKIILILVLAMLFTASNLALAVPIKLTKLSDNLEPYILTSVETTGIKEVKKNLKVQEKDFKDLDEIKNNINKTYDKLNNKPEVKSKKNYYNAIETSGIRGINKALEIKEKEFKNLDELKKNIDKRFNKVDKNLFSKLIN